MGSPVVVSNGIKAGLDPRQFAERVFHKEVMRRYLSDTAYEAVERWEQGEAISLELADEIAHALRRWAQEKGATHRRGGAGA